MTTQQVADRLVALCKKGEIFKAIEELYGDNIVSNEPPTSQFPIKVAKGKKAVLEKGKAFAETIEASHGQSISEPAVGGRFFSIGWSMDATFKGAGRMKLDEVCLYEVKDGKIVNEQFYY